MSGPLIFAPKPLDFGTHPDIPLDEGHRLFHLLDDIALNDFHVDEPDFRCALETGASEHGLCHILLRIPAEQEDPRNFETLALA